MKYSTYLLILTVSSIIMLEKLGDAKVMINDEYHNDLQEEARVLSERLIQRLVRRQTNCPRPYHVMSGGNCVWSCAFGTEPDDKTYECICQSGLYQNGIDAFGRRTCTICPTPYHVLINGRCVWSCARGTQPDDKTNECICQRGYFQDGTDNFKRRTCSICPGPYHVLSDGNCVWSCGSGTEPDNTSNECICQSGYKLSDTDTLGRRTCLPPT